MSGSCLPRACKRESAYHVLFQAAVPACQLFTLFKVPTSPITQHQHQQHHTARNTPIDCTPLNQPNSSTLDTMAYSQKPAGSGGG
jgi:hypothetical protein